MPLHQGHVVKIKATAACDGNHKAKTKAVSLKIKDKLPFGDGGRGQRLCPVSGKRVPEIAPFPAVLFRRRSGLISPPSTARSGRVR